MIRIACLAALVLAVAGCAAPRPPAEPTPGLDWYFLADGGTGKLAFGVPASDEILFQLECRKAGDEIQLSRPAAAGAPPEIVLSAEGVGQTRVAATSTASQTHDGVDLDAAVPADSPLLAGFRKGGWLGVQIGAEVRRYAAQPGGAAIDRFFAWCRS